MMTSENGTPERQFVPIPRETVVALLAYLEQRPYVEVAGGVAALVGALQESESMQQLGRRAASLSEAESEEAPV